MLALGRVRSGMWAQKGRNGRSRGSRRPGEHPANVLGGRLWRGHREESQIYLARMLRSGAHAGDGPPSPSAPLALRVRRRAAGNARLAVCSTVCLPAPEPDHPHCGFRCRLGMASDSRRFEPCRPPGRRLRHAARGARASRVGRCSTRSSPANATRTCLPISPAPGCAADSTSDATRSPDGSTSTTPSCARPC